LDRQSLVSPRNLFASAETQIEEFSKLTSKRKPYENQNTSLQRDQIKEKVAMIIDADTVIDPWTVAMEPLVVVFVTIE
jgi:hypothetical protein